MSHPTTQPPSSILHPPTFNLQSPSSILHLSLAILLLWAFFAQAVTSMAVESPTVDERVDLTRGYLYLELGDTRFKMGHPILGHVLSAIPIWTLADLSLPTDDPSWEDQRWGAFSERFLLRPGNDVALIFFLSRLMTVFLGTLFGALVFRWARQLWGRWGGLIALTLFVFDPTIVAHSRYTTDDIAVSLFCFAAAYGLWRYLESDRTRDLLLTGVAFGLAQGCKFSALMLIPAFIVTVGLWAFLRHPRFAVRPRCLHPRCLHPPGPPESRSAPIRDILKHTLALLVIFAVGGLILWAIYRFDFRPLPGWPFPVPATAYFEDIIWEMEYFEGENYAFLCGEISDTGWWYYLPVAFLLKSPLPALALIGTTLVSLVRLGQGVNRGVSRSGGGRIASLLLPACVYLVATVNSPLNTGYRYFIPVLPYLYVLTGRLATLPGKLPRLLLTGALICSAIVAVNIHPHYLAYFNLLAGGPDNGWRYLVDSNIDWGQDLPALHDLVERYDLGRLKLSYFGTAYPSTYGLDFEPLPTWEPTPEQGNPLTRTYYPDDPSPGVYAISATHLQGVVLDPDQWDTYAWFRDKDPFAKAGYSIFLYRVEPTGPPVDVALSGVQIDELTPDTFAAFGSNDVRLRWFDARTSLVIPSQPGWTVIASDEAHAGTAEPAQPAWATLEDLRARAWPASQPCNTSTRTACALYPPDPPSHTAAMAWVQDLQATCDVWHSDTPVPSVSDTSPLSLPVNLGAPATSYQSTNLPSMQFLGYAPSNLVSPYSDRSAAFLTAWRVSAPPDGQRAIFVHLLAPDGQVAAQWDGLDVPVEGWREGNTILQVASFDLPADLPPGQYWLQTGVYDPDTMQRLPVLADRTPIADRILLEPIRVGDAP